MSEERKKHYRFNIPINPEMFQRRDELRKWADEAHKDIMDWVLTLKWHGKIVGVDVTKIQSIELSGGEITIKHEIKNWMAFDDDDKTSIQTFKISADDFFHPEIVKDKPQQLDMGDIENASS